MLSCYLTAACPNIQYVAKQATSRSSNSLWPLREGEQAAALRVTLNDGDNICERTNVAMDLLEMSHCWTQAWLRVLTPWEMSVEDKWGEEGEEGNEGSCRARSHQVKIFHQFNVFAQTSYTRRPWMFAQEEQTKQREMKSFPATHGVRLEIQHMPMTWRLSMPGPLVIRAATWWVKLDNGRDRRNLTLTLKWPHTLRVNSTAYDRVYASVLGGYLVITRTAVHCPRYSFSLFFLDKIFIVW